ncbi:MAG: endolytic transglycosylase MltG [Xanthomonadales bacterium]|nr:endolytic transglycosylase MltG [Xanthomonadales bacterium]
MVRRLILVLVLVVGAALGYGWWSYQQFLVTPLQVPDGGTEWILERGTSYRAMVRDLAERGVLEDGWRWRLLGVLDPRTRRLQAGEYALAPDLTPSELLALLEAGAVVLHRFTIVEGWNFATLRATLLEHPDVEPDLGDLDGAALMASLGSDQSHPEGWFLPETYRFPRGTRATVILQRAHDAMRKALEEAWAGRATGLPLDSPYEALILASIIEKETAVPEERGEIAGVFVRRLERGMRLQTDPTVIYGIGPAFDGNLRRRDLRADTPYNTYTRHGLPPTPIALPGRASLEAAVNPAPGETLYFVSRGDGSHEFSVTYAEHERAVDRYQRKR